MKTLLRLEEVFLFAGGKYLFSWLPYAWWWFPALILLPDNGMVSPPCQVAGVILFSHTAMDRIMGYGLKFEKGFIFTHQGTIGSKQEPHV